MTLNQRTSARSDKARSFTLSAISCTAVALTVLCATSAQGFEIDTGNPDAVLRWDNTVRYNYGVRMKDRDAALIANPAARVTIAGTSYPVHAALLEDEERERGWQAFEEAARPYQVYGDRTDRTFRVFALSRRTEENDGS